jgi:hypothetical protein
MYEGILQKDESGTWYTAEGEALMDVLALLEGLPVGSRLLLQAPDVEPVEDVEEQPAPKPKPKKKKSVRRFRPPWK